MILIAGESSLKNVGVLTTYAWNILSKRLIKVGVSCPFKQQVTTGVLLMSESW